MLVGGDAGGDVLTEIHIEQAVVEIVIDAGGAERIVEVRRLIGANIDAEQWTVIGAK